MKKYAYLTSIIFSFSVALPFYSERHDKKTILYANELLDHYIKDPASEKLYALKELKSLTNKNPRNVKIRSIYLNILLLEKHYVQGLEQIKIINKTGPMALSKLNECLLTERVGKDPGSCYQQAAKLFSAKNDHDTNYILALKFSQDPNFRSERSRLVNAGKINKEAENIIDMDKQTFLATFYP
ncbi:hypothetical protein L2C91_09590 [Rosenbergiella epipactidis]|uniref:hypothetical protein n=1 Tax=Rosenbergiella epipactidis TaxID=1544694 RepID=UPI002025FAD8|nr:hypothetical protein [Rosenbergiella epipactidis]MCL9668620.1 hypothetical protein [Rosenbergiella epipactidis]